MYCVCLRMSMSTFHIWGGLVYSRCPTSWMVIKIRSHWLRYFLLLLISDSVMDIERAVYLG